MTTPSPTIAQLLQDTGARAFAHEYAQQAIYEVAEDMTRQEAIALVSAELRAIQQQEAPELTPVLQALEAAAGPQRVIGFETLPPRPALYTFDPTHMERGPSVTTLTNKQFQARFPAMFRMHAQEAASRPADSAGGEVAANTLVGCVLGAAANAKGIVLDPSYCQQRRLNKLAGFFDNLANICRAGAKGEQCCERAPEVLDLDRDLRSARAQRFLLTPCMDQLEAHRLEVERELFARYRRSLEQAPSQKQLHREAKRPTRNYFTRAVARRLGVQRDSL